MKFDQWWDDEGKHLGNNNLELAEAAFDAGRLAPEFKLQAVRQTLTEMNVICDNATKANKPLDRIHELILQLLDTCCS